MKTTQTLAAIFVVLSLAATATAQSRLDGDSVTISGGNFPESFGVTIDPETQEPTNHGSPAVEVTMNGMPQPVAGMTVVPTITPWPGREGGLPVVQAAGIDVEGMTVNEFQALDWENAGEIVEFYFETNDGGYVSQESEFGQSFITIEGLDWANSVDDDAGTPDIDESLPTFYEQGFYFYWTNQDISLRDMATIAPGLGLVVGPHPTNPDIPEIAIPVYSRNQVNDITEPYPGGTDTSFGTTQLDADNGSWDLLMQTLSLNIFGENDDGMPADGLAVGFLVTPPAEAGGGGMETCGDFDVDGDVDAADRTIQTVGWTGAIGDGSGTATFADGDCDGDGDVDTADQTGLIGNWTGALGGMAGNLTDGDDADLVYDPATGNVTIDASDTAAGQIISFVIGTDQNNMDTSATVVPFIDAGTNTDNTPFQIGQTDPLNQGAGPLVDIGNVLPAGMDLTALSEYLTIAEYASELGAGGTLDLRVVPEPSSVVLLLLGVSCLIRRRKRH